MENSAENSPTLESNLPKRQGWLARSFNPFRVATLRGLAIILPPLLTILLFIWAWNIIDGYVVRPVESALTNTIAYSIEEIVDDADARRQLASGKFSASGMNFIDEKGLEFAQIESGQWIPVDVITTAVESGSGNLNSAKSYFREFVQTKYLKRHLFIPAFLALFLVVLYLLGKLLAAGIGRIVLHYLEMIITQLPIIRNVYSSVKQVTDFALNENEMTFTRIVAVEYPRRGIWSMGFVTGEGMREIRDAAGEPILTILMPTSPMPATGFTISVPKSETIDLNITVDQAVQYCVSCGVVIPDHQQNRNTIDGEVKSRFKQIADSSQPSATTGSSSNGSNGSNGSSQEVGDKPSLPADQTDQ